ncbi:ABC transporter permease, partial [Pseudomonas sp. MPR-R2A5]
IGTLAGGLYFGLVFWVQDIPHGGNLAALALVVPLFAATVSALGMLAGSLVRSGDDALKLLIPTSIPFVFLSGFAWPLVAMPW